jgi:transcriptional regulator with XRE-family HTH domain
MKEFLHFPDRLRGLMRERGINNAQLGKAIGVSHVAVGNFLAGQLPKSEHLYELARFFGVPMEFFLEAEGESRRMLRETAGLAAYSVERLATPDVEKQRLFTEMAENLAALETAARSLRRVMGRLGMSMEPSSVSSSSAAARISSGATAEETRLLGALAGGPSASAPKSSRSRAIASPSAPVSAPSRAASTATKARPAPPKRAPISP